MTFRALRLLGLVTLTTLASITAHRHVAFAQDKPAGAAPAAPPAPPAPPTAGEVLSLADAVNVARTRGYDLLLASAAVKGAEADVRTASQLPNPAVTAGPSRRLDCYSGDNCSGRWGVFATLSDSGLIEGAITRKRRLKEDVAARALDAARFGRANAERVVITQAKIQYMQTAAASAKLDLTREVAASLEKSAEVNRARYPKVIDLGQLARVEQEALRAEGDVDLAVRQLRQEQIDLATILGNEGVVPNFVVERKSLDFRVPEALTSLDKTALLRTALENRADRKQAVAQVAQSEASISLAKRSRFPDMSLLVQYQAQGAGADAPQPPTLSVGVGVSLPVLYQQQGEIGRATADQQTAIITRKRLETTVFTDVEAAINTFATARRVVERYEGSLLERAKQARDITQIQYLAGSSTATLTDVLDAQRSYVQVNSGYLDELVNYWTAVFMLEQAVGKELVR